MSEEQLEGDGNEAVEPQSDEGGEQVTDEGQTEQTHDFNKGLQSVQQKLSSFERRVEERLEQLADMAASATTKSEKQEVKDEIDDLLEQQDFDVDGGKASKVLAQRVRQFQQKFSEYDDLVDHLNQRTLETEQVLSEMRFKAANPDINYEEVRKEADDMFKQHVRGVKDPQAQRVIWKMVSDQVMNKAKAKVQARSEPSETEQAGVEKPSRVKLTGGGGGGKPPKESGPKPLSYWQKRIADAMRG